MLLRPIREAAIAKAREKAKKFWVDPDWRSLFKGLDQKDSTPTGCGKIPRYMTGG